MTGERFTVEISKINWYSSVFKDNDNIKDIYIKALMV